MSVRDQRAVEALCHRQLVRLGYETERWSPVDAIYCWIGVLVYGLRHVPTAVRVRLDSWRRAY
jgi:hypothetical protein